MFFIDFLTFLLSSFVIFINYTYVFQRFFLIFRCPLLRFSHKLYLLFILFSKRQKTTVYASKFTQFQAVRDRFKVFCENFL
jgi:hypothetical protein